jgi:hypothetical protein
MAETTSRARKSPPKPPKEEAPPVAEPGPPRTEAAAEPAKEHVCNVAFCPIGLAMSAVQGAAPDVMEHLLKAASEFLLAARAVIDARADHFEETREDDGGLTRIEIS